MTAFSLPANDKKEVKKVFKEGFSVEILCLVKQLILRQFSFYFVNQRGCWPESPRGWGLLVRTNTFSGLFFREEPWARKVGLSTDVLMNNPLCIFLYFFVFVLSTYFYVTTLLNYLFIYLRFDLTTYLYALSGEFLPFQVKYVINLSFFFFQELLVLLSQVICWKFSKVGTVFSI